MYSIFNVVLLPILRREPLRRSSGGTERARKYVPGQEKPKVKQIGVKNHYDPSCALHTSPRLAVPFLFL